MQGEETIYIDGLRFGEHGVIGAVGGHGRASEASGWKSDCGVLLIEKMADPDSHRSGGYAFFRCF